MGVSCFRTRLAVLLLVLVALDSASGQRDDVILAIEGAALGAGGRLDVAAENYLCCYTKWPIRVGQPCNNAEEQRMKDNLRSKYGFTDRQSDYLNMSSVDRRRWAVLKCVDPSICGAMTSPETCVCPPGADCSPSIQPRDTNANCDGQHQALTNILPDLNSAFTKTPVGNLCSYVLISAAFSAIFVEPSWNLRV